MQFINRNFFISLTVNLVLFLSLWFFLFPVYRSGDDVFLLYLMGGGFGDTPTNLLHYNHLMHPLLGWCIKTLFIKWGFVNWYSIALLVAHFISCCVVLYVLLQLHKKWIASLLYTLFFLVFECWFLLQLTFSVTSIICTVAAFVWLLYYSWRNKPLWYYVLPVLLFLIASLFRIHTMAPVVIIFTPLFFTIKWMQQRLRFILSGLIVLVGTLLLNIFHTSYYKAHIPQWEQAEQYRQALFDYFNKPISYEGKSISDYDAKRQMLEYGLYIDKNYLDVATINVIGKQAHQDKYQSFDELLQTLYWPFIESRIFLAAFLFTLIVALSTVYGNHRFFILTIAMIAPLFILYLHRYMKLPFYLVPAILGSAFCGLSITSKTKALRQRQAMLLSLFACLLFIWAGVRIYKINTENKTKNAEFRLAIQQINSSPHLFFVLVQDLFPMDYFAVKDAPAQYPLTNAVYKDHFFHNEADKIIKRNGLFSTDSLWMRDKVVFWNKTTVQNAPAYSTLFKQYFADKFHTEISFSDPLPGYNYGEVRKLVLKTDSLR